jgi:hypothetical protein
MKLKFSAAPLALAAALIAAPLAAFAAGGQIGVNAAIRNSVQMKTSADARPRPAVLREAVHIGDMVSSGPNSALQVLLLDRTVFTIGANARMTIDRFVYDPNRRSSDVAASVAKGSFRFMSGRSLSGQGRSAVTTPVASIGVRGTIFEGAVGPDVLDILAGQPGIPAFSGDPSGATLIILRGPGPNTQGFDKTGAIDVTAGGVTRTLDQPGQAALVWPGQAPIIFFLSDAASQRLSALLLGAPGPNGLPGIGIGPVGSASGDILTVGLPRPGVAGAGGLPTFDLPFAKQVCSRPSDPGSNCG